MVKNICKRKRVLENKKVEKIVVQDILKETNNVKVVENKTTPKKVKTEKNHIEENKETEKNENV
jgi:hypothetical protein